MNEVFLASILCALILDGEAETHHAYTAVGETRHVEVDCETATHVYEVGLDKRSSIDSAHQAIFASVLTGKSPGIVMIDTNGQEDRFELQVRTTAQALGIAYQVFDKDYLLRWQMTDYLRNYPAPTPASFP